MLKKGNAALGFIFITILIDVIGMGIIIPVIPGILKEITGTTLSEASKYGSLLIVTYAIIQFLFSPVLGGLSDRFGRRPVLLLSLLGLGVDYLFTAFAPTLMWLVIGRLIAGIGGASFTTASAYIADISTPEKRAQNFGMVGAAFGLGFIIGPAIGALCSELGLRAPFIVAACLSILNFLYGYFVLPESLKPENRRKFEWKRANPAGMLVQLGKYPTVAQLVVPLVLIYIAAHSVQSVWGFYTMYKFEWDEGMVGYSLSFVGLMIAIVQGGLIRVIMPKLGQKNAVYAGLLLYALGLLLFGFATEGWMMFAILVIYALGGICGPALQGIMSSSVPPNEQGELQGALTSLMSLTLILGPLLMNNLFAYFSSTDAPVHLPGAPYYAGAFLTLVSILFVIRPLSMYKPPANPAAATVNTGH
jgi:MFS transporter, DHA1 family, tetracycline resistance protein